MQTDLPGKKMNLNENKFLGWPVSKIGKIAAWLLLTFLIMFLINGLMFMPLFDGIPYQEKVLPYYGIVMLMTGAASGIAGLIAKLKFSDRSWVVWLSIIPVIFVLFLLLGEFLFPH